MRTVYSTGHRGIITVIQSRLWPFCCPRSDLSSAPSFLDIEVKTDENSKEMHRDVHLKCQEPALFGLETVALIVITPRITVCYAAHTTIYQTDNGRSNDGVRPHKII